MDNLTEILKGILEGCVLEIINKKETYGYEITRTLNELGFTDVIEATVYTILIRLEKNDLVNIEKKNSTLGPPRKFYSLNDNGKEKLLEFWQKWKFVSSKLSELKEDKKMDNKKNDFFNTYFNIAKMLESKKEYKKQLVRIEALPEDYKYVFKKMQEYMWRFALGSGYDMIEIQYDLIELFEQGAIEDKYVLDITGEDVAKFCDELLYNAKTYTENWRNSLNQDVAKKVGKRKNLI